MELMKLRKQVLLLTRELARIRAEHGETTEIDPALASPSPNVSFTDLLETRANQNLAEKIKQLEAENSVLRQEMSIANRRAEALFQKCVTYEKERLPSAGDAMITKLLQEELDNIIKNEMGVTRNSLPSPAQPRNVVATTYHKLERKLSSAIGKISIEQDEPEAPITVKVEPVRQIPLIEKPKEPEDEEQASAPDNKIAELITDYASNATNLILNNDKVMAQADELLANDNYYSINDFEDLDIGEEFTQQILQMLNIT
jgi:hypothetical protein